MARTLRVLLWTVVLVAPGGFLLVPVLAATSRSSRSSREPTLRARASILLSACQQRLATIQRYWTKR